MDDFHKLRLSYYDGRCTCKRCQRIEGVAPQRKKLSTKEAKAKFREQTRRLLRDLS